LIKLEKTSYCKSLNNIKSTKNNKKSNVSLKGNKIQIIDFGKKAKVRAKSGHKRSNNKSINQKFKQQSFLETYKILSDRDFKDKNKQEEKDKLKRPRSYCPAHLVLRNKGGSTVLSEVTS